MNENDINIHCYLVSRGPSCPHPATNQWTRSPGPSRRVSAVAVPHSSPLGVLKKKNLFFFLPLLSSRAGLFIRHPWGVEEQSPPMAAGHRSLCPRGRRSTYCQLTLRWKPFHHPPEKTIKNTCCTGGDSTPPHHPNFSYSMYSRCSRLS